MLDLKPAGSNDEDVVVVAPPIDGLSAPAHHTPHPSPEAPHDTKLDFVAERWGPPTDTTLSRVAPDAFAVEGHAAVESSDEHPWLGGLMKRAAVALVVMLLGSVATLAWRFHGNEASQIVARWTPDIVLAWLPVTAAEPSSQSAGQAAEVPASQPNAQPASQEAGPQQPAHSALAPPAAVALPAPDSVLQAMARDLEKAQQAIEQLKGNQDQLAREVAKLGEQAARHRSAAPSPRPTVTASRKPAPAVPGSPAAIQQRPAPSSPAVAPTAVQPQPSSAPRPPAALP
ncbi:MAG: hypothetical protein P4M07_19660 [Xanthobacteraceae bacterium]|nr:hypothetical protein [Xanthobacteraceae bacterium]